MWNCRNRQSCRVKPGSTLGSDQHGKALENLRWSLSSIRGPAGVELHLDNAFTRRPIEENDGQGDWHSRDNLGATPFLKRLLRRQISCLATFAARERVDIRALLQQTYLPNPGTSEELRLYEGENALHIAVALGNHDLAKEMLAMGMDSLLEGRAIGSYFKLNGPCGLGEHPLFFAVGLDNREMAELLLEKGACVRSKDSAGHSLLHLAVFRNLPEMFEFAHERMLEGCRCRNCRQNGKPSADETTQYSPEQGFSSVVTLGPGHHGQLIVQNPLRSQLQTVLELAKEIVATEVMGESTEVEAMSTTVRRHMGSSVQDIVHRSDATAAANNKVPKLPHPDEDPCCHLSNYKMTPVVLAAELGQLEVLELVLRRRSRKLYTYAGMEAQLYSLQDLDNFPTFFYTGRYPEAPCVLDVLARYTWNSRLKEQLRILDHPVIALLLEKKWVFLAQPVFRGQFVLALVHTAVLTAAFVTHRVARYTPVDFILMIGVASVAMFSFTLLAIDVIAHRLGAIFDIGGVPMFREFANLAYELCVLTSGLLQLGGSPGHWEVIANAGVIILGYADLLYFFLGWELFGTFAVMVWTILTKDVARFVLLYLTFLVSFALALFGGILYDPDDPAVELQDAFLHPVGTWLGGIQSQVFLSFGPKWFGVVLFVVWVILSTMLLANLLIAMMNQTFSDCSAHARKRWLIERLRVTMSIQSELFSWQVWGLQGLRKSLRDAFLKSSAPDTTPWYWRVPAGASPHPDKRHGTYKSLNESELRYWVDEPEVLDPDQPDSPTNTIYRHSIAVHIAAKVTLRISGLPRRWRDAQLRELVRAVCQGQVQPEASSADPKFCIQLISARVLMDELTGISTAVGLVTFTEPEGAAEALELLDGLEVQESWTRPTASHSSSSKRLTAPPLPEVGMGLHRGTYRLAVEIFEDTPKEQH